MQQLDLTPHSRTTAHEEILAAHTPSEILQLYVTPQELWWLPARRNHKDVENSALRGVVISYHPLVEDFHHLLHPASSWWTMATYLGYLLVAQPDSSVFLYGILASSRSIRSAIRIGW
jgi:hypothetical protein